MKPYDTYELADFLLDDDFVAWVKHPTRESELFWQQWLQKNPHRASVVEEARYWATHLTVNEQLPSNQAVANSVAHIEAQLSEKHTVVLAHPSRKWLNTAWRVAAAVVVMLGIGWYALTNQKSATNGVVISENGAVLITQENKTGRPLSLQLPDGSRIVLAPASRVEFPKQFAATRRNIKLTGEAFFVVVRQPQRPFVVHAGHVNVKVLGTSFRVQTTGKKGEVNVAVKSGKVAVSKAVGTAGPDQAAVLLTPNQQVTFSTRDDVFRKALVEAPIVVNQQSKETDFTFDETPIADVFDKLQVAYGVQIDFDREKLAHCTLTAQLANESMYKKLNLICQAIGGTHETVGTTIIIHAERCNP